MEASIPVIGQPVDRPIAQVEKTRELDRAILEGYQFFQEGGQESWSKAIGKFETVLKLARSAQAKNEQSLALFALARIHDALGDKQKALDYYHQVLPFYRTVSDSPERMQQQRFSEASTLNNIGLAYADLGELQKALDYYTQALSTFRLLSDDSSEGRLRQRGGEVATLSNIGSVYAALGEKQKALDYYTQALSISRAVGDRSGEAETLKTMAEAMKMNK